MRIDEARKRRAAEDTLDEQRERQRRVRSSSRSRRERGPSRLNSTTLLPDSQSRTRTWTCGGRSMPNSTWRLGGLIRWCRGGGARMVQARKTHRRPGPEKENNVNDATCARPGSQPPDCRAMLAHRQVPSRCSCEAPDVPADPSPAFEYYNAEAGSLFRHDVAGGRGRPRRQAASPAGSGSATSGVLRVRHACIGARRGHERSRDAFRCAGSSFRRRRTSCRRRRTNAMRWRSAFRNSVLETDAAFHAWLPDSTGRVPTLTAAGRRLRVRGRVSALGQPRR